MSVRALFAPIKVESENAYRSMANPFAGVHRTKKQRQDTAALLTQIQRRPTDQSAFFAVTLTRYSAGYLDDDNLRGAFKAVRDEVAHWLGVDDGDEERVRWVYAQEPARKGEFAIRIAIEDGKEGVDVERYHNFGKQVPRAAAKKPAPQLSLPKRKCYALLPWDQDGGDPSVQPLALTGDNPPARIKVRTPAKVLSGAASIRYAPGSELVLERTVTQLEGESIFLYIEQSASGA